MYRRLSMARNKYPEQTVAKILKVSGQLFYEKGYENTSMQDIVDQLHLSKGAIYHHFRSKEDLLNRLTEDYYKNNTWFTEIENGTQSGLEKLKQIFRHELGDNEKQKIDTISAHSLQDPKMIIHQLESSIHEIAPMLCAILEQGNQDGSISTPDPKHAAEVLIVLINIWINPSIYPVTKEDFLKKIEFFGYTMKQLGVPILDDELRNLCIQYYDSVVSKQLSQSE